MKISVDADYVEGDVVYVKHDCTQSPHIVTGYLLRNAKILYEVTCYRDTLYCMDYELSSSRDITLVTSS